MFLTYPPSLTYSLLFFILYLPYFPYSLLSLFLTFLIPYFHFLPFLSLSFKKYFLFWITKNHLRFLHILAGLKCLLFFNIPISHHGEMHQTKLVLTKNRYYLDKSELVFKNPVNICWTKLDKSKLVSNNPVYSRQTKPDKFTLVLSNSVNSFSILFSSISVSLPFLLLNIFFSFFEHVLTFP